ncbi:hypothetical protein chiPu_0007363 [Chiloscyllium punctatum]|uniref:Uncharacterized protein n=1 Tax=Chiloscyllium punctatum TaxID=137246 RepID=A0A401SEV4_CHIPU|nr:hypothetical protein [Chiloscyllium punctatum]
MTYYVGRRGAGDGTRSTLVGEAVGGGGGGGGGGTRETLADGDVRTYVRGVCLVALSQGNLLSCAFVF